MKGKPRAFLYAGVVVLLAIPPAYFVTNWILVAMIGGIIGSVAANVLMYYWDK